MRPAYRARLAANLVNGSTLAGLLVAVAGRARLRPGRDGLLIGTRYRLPVPATTAFTVGNVVVTRLADGAQRGDGALREGGPLLAHEARHATQYACCGGLPLLPAYVAAAAWSWVVTGDFGARNLFEVRAGLADGGYSPRPVRAAWTRFRLEVRGRAEISPAAGAGPAAAPGPRLHPGTDR